MIGIFDSGCGGLTVLSAIKKKLPDADILYFGDTKNAPYGEKSREELFRLTGHALSILNQGGATSIVSACNSVSMSLALSLFDTLSLPSDRLIEMVGPTVRHFKGSSARIGLCATAATIESGVYQSAFRMLGKDVDAIAIPRLAGAIEAGTPEPEIRQIIADALVGREDAYDVFILACTHYPLVIESFAAVLAPETEIFDPATAVAEQVAEKWWPREVGDGKTRFLVSRDSRVFRRFVESLYPGGGYTIEVLE